MRESQKMRLDIRLHQKIIDSIVMIQRWFRGILQRRKFVLFRSAAVTVQSFWRMCVAQKQFQQLRQARAAVRIQATWRMFVTRRWFLKMRVALVIVQAHIRGKLARVRFKKAFKQKLLKDRAKLKQTQSLPVHERSVDYPVEVQDMYVSRKLVGKKPQYNSLDIDMEAVAKGHVVYPATVMNRGSEENIHQGRSSSPPLITPITMTALNAEQHRHNQLQQQQQQHNMHSRREEDVLNKAENQFRSLMIATSGNNNNLMNNNEAFSNISSSPVSGTSRAKTRDDYHDYQNLKYSPYEKGSCAEDNVDRVTQMYDLMKAYTICTDNR